MCSGRSTSFCACADEPSEGRDLARANGPIDRFERLFSELRRDAESASIVARSKLRLRFEFAEPEGSLNVDGRVRPFALSRDAPSGFPPDLTLAMSCDTAHRFFLGTLDLSKAILTREISSKGSLLKMLELRALLQRAREIYRQVK